MSVIRRECTHAVPTSLISRSSVCVCMVWVPSCGQAGAGGPPGVAAQALGNWLWPFTSPTPPPPPLSPAVILPATWSSHIYHSQLKRQKAAGKCWGRGTIIHVAHPLMQICLLMKAFWAKRICLTAMLRMSAPWPRCLIALSARSWVRFSFLLSVLFLRHVRKTINWAGQVVTLMSRQIY